MVELLGEEHDFGFLNCSLSLDLHLGVAALARDGDLEATGQGAFANVGTAGSGHENWGGSGD